MANNFLTFAEQWINRNVKNDLYSTMPKMVLEIVTVLAKQRHSGASMMVVMKYLVVLFEDYND